LKEEYRPNGNLIGQKTDAWEGGHRVPCIARWPKQIPGGSQRNELFVLVDLMSTLAEAADIEMPKGASPDGISQLAAVKNPSSSPAQRTEAVLHGTGPSSYILRQGDWVYIPKQGSGGKTVPQPKRPWSLPYGEMGFKNSDVDDQGQIKQGVSKVQLYNLATDPFQASNVAAEHAEKIKAMHARLNELTGKN
jgi:arylsulfatase A-like enzyme